jgi:Flp pilus assembly protein TadD
VGYGSGRWHALAVGAVGFAIAAAYAVSLRGEFIFDDIHHIIDNRGIRDLGDLGAVLRGGLQETRPVFLLSLALNYWAHGTDVLGYHLVNVALHIACAAAVYALAVVMRRDLAAGRAAVTVPADALRWFPEIAAGVFALHPLATESVAYVNSRSGLLAAAFALAGMLLWLRWDARRGERAAWAGQWAAVACMALAMGSKESAVVAPVLLAVYRSWFRQGGDARRAAREAAALAPVLATVVIVPLLFVTVTNPHRGTIGADTLPVVHHWLTQAKVIAFFLGQLLLLRGQNIDHDFPVSTGIDAAVIASGLVVAAVIALAVTARRRAPGAAFGAVWFFVALAPTNSVVPFKDFIAERHLYLPLAGFALVVGWAVARGVARLRAGAPRLAPVAAAAVGALLIALGAMTAARSRVLADPLALWTETAKLSPDKARPHVNLGILLLARGEVAAGRAHLERAVELDPDDARAAYNLGVFHERAGDHAQALIWYRRAAAEEPRARYRRSLALTANELGIARFRAGEGAEAEALLREAIAAAPDFASPHFNLAVVLMDAGRADEARAELERTLALDPAHDKARAKLASLGR